MDPSAPDSAAVFGYGRRICPGMFMAPDSLWITAAYLVWAFDIGKFVNKDGSVDEPSGEFEAGLVR